MHDAKLRQVATVAKRIACIPTTRRKRAAIATAIIYGKCLYGQESHYLTRCHFQQLRNHVVASMGVPKGQRQSRTYLLNFLDGKFDPEIVRASRLIKVWLRLLLTFTSPQDYWRQCRQ